MKSSSLVSGLNQERIVFLITVLLFAVFALSLNNFLSTANMLSLLRSVSVLGILGLGMLVVVLGRGIDLSMVAIMAISVAWTMQLVGSGASSLSAALALGLGFAVLMSLISGVVIAYGEIPPLFATLAMGTFVYGFGRAHLIIGTDVVYMPGDIGWIKSIGQGSFLGVPMPVVVAFGMAMLIWAFLRFTKPGRYLTLTTCTPEFQSTNRLIVWGKLVEDRPRSKGKPAALVDN